MKTIIVAIGYLLFVQIGYASIQLKSDADHSSVNFLAVGKPSMLKIRGEASGLKGDWRIEKNQLIGMAEFEMDKLDTGIGLRNQHMKEKYLQTKEYPMAKLTLVEAPLDANFENGLSNSDEKPFKGKLALHGKEREVSGLYSVKAGNVNARFTINISDFGIDVPSYLGITVTEKVDVSVAMQLKKE